MLKKNHDRVALIGWIVSILVPVIVSLLPVSGIFTGSLKTFFVITLFVILIIAFELLPKLIDNTLTAQQFCEELTKKAQEAKQ